MDCTQILTVPSGMSKKKSIDRYDPAIYSAMDNVRISKKYGLVEEFDSSEESSHFMKEFLVFHSYLPDSLSTFSRNCVAYIAGWVVKKNYR